MIKAERFKVEDINYNLPTKDFLTISDNEIYNIQDQDQSNELSSHIFNLNSNNILTSQLFNSLNSTLNELRNLIQTNPNQEAIIENSLNNTLNTLSDPTSSYHSREVSQAIHNVDQNALRDFVKNIKRIGAVFLCNALRNFNFFLLGYSINRNILEGLLLALFMEWLNRFCRKYLDDDLFGLRPYEVINTLHPYPGVYITSNAYDQFKSHMRDYYTYINYDQVTYPTLYSNTEILDKILLNELDDVINNLKSNEIDDQTKSNIASYIETQMSNYNINSENYYKLSIAKGKILSTVMINEEKRNRLISNQYAQHKLGSFLKNSSQASIPDKSEFNLSPNDESLYDRFKSTMENPTIRSYLKPYDHSETSFKNLNFNLITQYMDLTAADISNITSHKSDYKTYSHRLYEYHPTTEVFVK
ncbi:MAG: hypothetical protein QXF12_07760 [Candidatus Aenigmatarchaeota archaeon]